MNLTILNREFQHPSDGWYQIEAKGEHANRAAGVVQMIDDEATAAIVNRFNQEATSGQLRHGNEMLIDHEHFSDNPEKESRAYGWLQELQNRADGIYGRIRWTTTGKAAVDGGDYRFFSTEYAAGDVKVVNGVGTSSTSSVMKRIRPLRLDGLTLTNMNNNRGQKPITNRGGVSVPANRPGSSGASPHHEFPQGTNALADVVNQNKGTPMKSVAALLGLSADASEEAIHAEVTKCKNRVTTLEGEVAPLQNRSTELETENKTLLGEQCDALLDAHGVKEDDKRRPHLVNNLKTLKNREARTAFLADFGLKPVEAKAPSTNVRVLNRQDGTQTETLDVGNHEESKFKRLVNRHVVETKLTKSAAVQRAISESPEAYAEWLKAGAGNL